MPQPAAVKRLIRDFTNRSPMRTTSLIVTVFGDVVSQHGNTLWLGSLVKAMAPMGINERLVRTSVFRLVQEGWLESERVGRRSFYRFTDYGNHEYERAARRIYALDGSKWRGQWQLLIPQDIPEDRREQFRRSLHWLGYRAIAAGTYAKPGDGGDILGETLEEFNVANKVIVLDAQTAAISSTRLVRKLVHDNWQLEVVAQGYRKFLKRYKPLLKWAQRKQAPEAAFVARTLLIHDYRRILLNDTPLPDELLPSDWPGAKALKLAAVVYKALAPASIDYIDAELESGNGSLPTVDTQFWKRFERVT